LNKTKKAFLYKIFKFYDLFNDQHFEFRYKTQKVFKKIILSRNLREIIHYLLGLHKNDVEILISMYKKEIVKVAENYSKYDIDNNFRGLFINKYSKSNLKLVKSLFQNRLKEKYFFDP